MKRRSPIIFDAEPEAIEARNGWDVVRIYKDEAGQSGLSDLSHWPKWDIQDKDLARISLESADMPVSPGNVSIQNGHIILRLNRTQAIIWQFGNDGKVRPDHPAFSDVTDAYALLALFGPSTPSIMEKITALDLWSSEKSTPFLLQGPVLHIPMQVVVLGDQPGIMMAFARGYGQTVADALLDAGAEFDLKPAGEQSFLKCLNLA